MELPSDLKVNGQFYMHLTVREGGAPLHLALLDFYHDSFGLDRVVLRDETNKLTKAELADYVGGAGKQKLENILIVRVDGIIEEISSTFNSEG